MHEKPNTGGKIDPRNPNTSETFDLQTVQTKSFCAKSESVNLAYTQKWVLDKLYLNTKMNIRQPKNTAILTDIEIVRHSIGEP